jgi:hypothetical protein
VVGRPRALPHPDGYASPSQTFRMSACTLAAFARMANEIASRSSGSDAPAALAPARSRFAQWVFPAARLAAR